jgi:hypothetical protein
LQTRAFVADIAEDAGRLEIFEAQKIVQESGHDLGRFLNEQRVVRAGRGA